MLSPLYRPPEQVGVAFIVHRKKQLGFEGYHLIYCFSALETVRFAGELKIRQESWEFLSWNFIFFSLKFHNCLFQNREEIVTVGEHS